MLSLESAVAKEKRKLENLDRLLMEKGLTAADILELEQTRDIAAESGGGSSDVDVGKSSVVSL